MKTTGSALLGLLLTGGLALAQTARPPAAPAPKAAGERPDERSSAYYHYALGHLYAELAGAYGNRGDYLNKAIESYRQAIKADPESAYLTDELSDLYIQSQRLRAGIAEAEGVLAQNPNDLSARRILGRIYTRLVTEGQQGQVDEEYLKKAIEQYQKISERLPNDTGNWMLLGRLYKVAQKWTDAEKAYQKVLAAEPENEDALTGLAMVYADLGDNKRASETLQKVVERAPSLRTLTALATTYEQMRDYDRAAETLRRALAASPDNVEVKRALAQNLLLAEKLPDAVALYQELAAEEPREPQHWLRLSQIHRQQREFDKSREALAKARELDPNSLELRYNEVNLLESEGKTAEATRILKEMLDATAKRTYNQGEKSNRLVFLERLGLLYRNSEQYDLAAQVFREMGEVDPDVAARSAAQVVDTYRQGRQYAKAESEAEAALKRFPNERLLHVVRSAVLSESGKHEQAVTELKTLLDGKNDRETYLSLAQAYEKGKNFDEMAKAIDAAEKLSASKEEREAIHFTRGAMLERRKRFDAAEAEFRKALELNPENASALNYLGYMLADRNVRLNEAQQLVAKALELDPDNAAYLDSIGWVYYRQGKLEEAESHLRRAVEKYSKDATVHDHLGDVYLKQGKLKEAAAQWQRALREAESASATDRESIDLAGIQKKLDAAKVRLAREGSAPGAKQRQ